MRRPLRSLLRALSAALLAVAAATAGVEAKPAPKKPAAAAAAAKAKTVKAKAKAKATREAKAKGGKSSGAKATAKAAKGKKATAKASTRAAKRTTKSAKGTKTVRAAKATKAKKGAARESRRETRRETGRTTRRETPRTLATAIPVAPTVPTNVPTVDLATALGADLVKLPDVATTAAGERAGPARPFAALSATATSMIDELVNRARSQLGTRYVFGGARPGESLDCSSFARYAMEALGFRLPRTADEQSRLGRAVPRDPSALKPGDLLTFGTRRRVDHVGIYLGEGRFIHASVKSGQVIETTIARNGSLFRKWLGARRLIADADTARPTGG